MYLQALALVYIYGGPREEDITQVIFVSRGFPNAPLTVWKRRLSATYVDARDPQGLDSKLFPAFPISWLGDKVAHIESTLHIDILILLWIYAMLSRLSASQVTLLSGQQV